MKHVNSLLLGLILGLSLFLTSCEDEENENPESEQINVQFNQSNLVLTESENYTTVTILLNKPAAKAGFVNLSFSGDESALFESNPEFEDGSLRLEVEKGSSSITFEIKALDDSEYQGAKNTSINIDQVSAELKVGTKNKLDLIRIDDEGPVTVNFGEASKELFENAASAYVVEIYMSVPATSDGRIKIEYLSDELAYGDDFTTYPEAEGSIIEVPVSEGDVLVSLAFYPVDNADMEGDKTITFNINTVEGEMEKGELLEFLLTLKDDETLATPKGYETLAGNWSYKAEFEYDAMGRISKRKWEQNTPGKTTGTDTYYYDNENRLTKISKVGGDEIYIWEEGRIVRMDFMDDGEIDEQIIYDYDEYGNVAGMAIYHKQPGGEMKMTMIFIYLYYLDGNIYKELVYLPTDDPEEPTLHSTRTYENYIDAINPFPMVQPLPNINSQRNLPGSYRLQENGSDLKYFFSYEFRGDGLPSKRYVSGSGSEVTTYQYY